MRNIIHKTNTQKANEIEKRKKLEKEEERKSNVFCLFQGRGSRRFPLVPRGAILLLLITFCSYNFITFITYYSYYLLLLLLVISFLSFVKHELKGSVEV